MTHRLSLTRAPWDTLAPLWNHQPSGALDVDSEILDLIAEEIAARFEHEGCPRRNIWPTQRVLVIRSGWGSGHISDPWDNYLIDAMQWGLVPEAASHAGIGDRLPAVRAASVGEREIVAQLVQRQRCLVVADGFYALERVRHGRRRAHLFTFPDQGVVCFAGVWDEWNDHEGRRAAPLISCALITAPSTPEVDPFCDQMPVMISPNQWRTWLDPSLPSDEVMALLRPDTQTAMEHAEIEELRPDRASNAPSNKKKAARARSSTCSTCSPFPPRRSPHPAPNSTCSAQRARAPIRSASPSRREKERGAQGLYPGRLAF